MKNKRERIAVIRDIIQNSSVSSQEELLQALKIKGFVVTQATLSRDLKQMQIAKVATREGGYVYVMPDVAATVKQTGGVPHYVPSQPVQGVVSIEYSNVLVVIRTRPGYASSIAYNIDMASLPEVMGTIAGDDTVLVIPRAGYAMFQVADSLCDTLAKK